MSLRTLADEVSRVSLEVGSKGKLGGQAHVPDVEGVWKDLTVNVRKKHDYRRFELTKDTGQQNVSESDYTSAINCYRYNRCG